MSPTVVALARTFSKDFSDKEQQVDEQQVINTTTTADYQHESVNQQHHAKSKSRSATPSPVRGGRGGVDLKSNKTTPSLQASPPSGKPFYHYDPYHQYCTTGTDYYKSYHLSYQAYCHPSKSKLHKSEDSVDDVRFYDPIRSRAAVDAINAALRPPNKLAAARARAVKLRRKISDFRNRTFTRIQRLALITISVFILAFIFTRSVFPTKIQGLINPTQFRRGISLYTKSLVGLNLGEPGLPLPTGFCENGPVFGFDPERTYQTVESTEPVLENLFGSGPSSTTNKPEDLPTIARNVLLKFYALAFLALLLAVSFACERLFGCKITVQHEDIDDEEILEDDLEGVDSEDEEDDDDIDNYVVEDLYWDCQPASIRVPRLPIHKLGVKSPELIVTDLKVSLLCLLPLRFLSRCWGWLNGVELPVWARAPLYRWYAVTFGCNLDEMNEEDLSTFRNLGEFFRRTLKPGVRPIGDASVVSPADGRVVQLESIAPSSGYVGSVKGIHYSVDNFLGPNAQPPKLQPGNQLYSCVVYLAPGDYHRFHSPANWTVKSRRHFSGRLLSVKPSFVAQVPNLFAINERVAYFGEWKHGFFSMTAVGATNVGTVNVYFDPELQTNKFVLAGKYRSEKHFAQTGIPVRKGDLFGEFNLGSTIVLIYEAPEHITHLPNDLLNSKIQYGQNIHHHVE